MSELDELRRQIRELSPKDFAELRNWLLELDNELWDAQIEADALSGRLDTLVDEALSDLAAGRVTVLSAKKPRE